MVRGSCLYFLSTDMYLGTGVTEPHHDLGGIPEGRQIANGQSIEESCCLKSGSKEDQQVQGRGDRTTAQAGPRFNGESECPTPADTHRRLGEHWASV